MNLHALSSNRQLTHFLQTSRLFCELAGFFIGYEVLLEVKGEALIDLFFFLVFAFVDSWGLKL